ncbi:MAG: hypothetical protein M3280_12045 [Actinomycetota bacterium]|nr:hypothetical protein [Actinomycetota bacterium]
MRRFLLFGAVIAVVAGGVVIALALGDSGSDGSPGEDGIEESTPSVADESPDTPGSPDDSPEETAEPGTASSPSEAAERLLQAWLDDDRPRALEVAGSPAVDSLFRLRAAPGYELRGCRPQGSGHSCAFFLESPGGAGAALLMLVDGSEDSGFRVNQVKSIGAD